MGCPASTILREYAGDKITVIVNVLLNGVPGQDLTTLTPQVSLNTTPPIEPTYDVSEMDHGVLGFSFGTAQTSGITPGDYVIGCAMIMTDAEPRTFLELDLELSAAISVAA